MRACYLLCFDKTIGNLNNPRAQAKHYIGWAKNLDSRIAAHRIGAENAAKITQFLYQQGIPFEVSRIWKGGTRKLERRLKNRKNAKLICPYCSGQNALKKAKYSDEKAIDFKHGK